MKRPFAVRGLDHVVLRVANLARSLAFYTDVLGCELERQLPTPGLYQLRAGDHLIDLVPLGSVLGGEAAVAQPGNMAHFCLRVSPFDGDALSSWLRTHGCEPGLVETRYGASGPGLSLYVQDPDDNVVEIRGA